MTKICSLCTPSLVPPDYDLFRISLNLERGRAFNLTCRVCNIRGIYKDDEGLIYLAKNEPEGIRLHLTTIEQLIK